MPLTALEANWFWELLHIWLGLSAPLAFCSSSNSLCTLLLSLGIIFHSVKTHQVFVLLLPQCSYSHRGLMQPSQLLLNSVPSPACPWCKRWNRRKKWQTEGREMTVFLKEPLKWAVSCILQQDEDIPGMFPKARPLPMSKPSEPGSASRSAGCAHCHNNHLTATMALPLFLLFPHLPILNCTRLQPVRQSRSKAHCSCLYCIYMVIPS